MGQWILKQLSADLTAEFPDMKGFSYSNIKYIRQWYLFYSVEAGNYTASCCTIGPNPMEPQSGNHLQMQGCHRSALLCQQDH
ncbi:DUF1016 N-terminal domain-containing protein [uncultured Desulfobacter sp.]|uniref:DUF1016 N-terminal domain-containing protein n=1 Tax=uncultured Desulfobacter sp. TaxID=240139 RepID=UPI003747F375